MRLIICLKCAGTNQPSSSQLALETTHYFTEYRSCRAIPAVNHCTTISGAQIHPNVANVNATCARNENGDFCYRTVFPLDGTTDISSVFQACSGTIFSLTNASCSEDCMNTLRSWSEAAGCCITSVYGLVNDTNVQLLLADRFWISCQVDRQGACPEAFQSTPSPGSTGTSSPGFEATDASVQAAIANSFIICMLATAVSLIY